MGRWMRKLAGYSVIAISLAIGWSWIKYDVYQDTPLFDGDEVLYYSVKPGSSVKRIARELAAAEIIKQPHFFEWFAQIGRAHV